MPWFVPYVPESIKKRVCIYLLQRYLGQFFEEKLRLDQLSVDLYNGTGILTNVTLDVQALNELGEKQNWPMEFVDGYLEELYISVPWSSLLKESTFLQVKGLKLTVQPKQRDEEATSMFESMWSSMTNSMQMAQECMKQDSSSPSDSAQPFEGIEKFAQTIDSILCKVKVKFINTILQIEHVPKDSNSGVAIKIVIEAMEYSDEAGDDPPLGETTDLTNQEQNKAYLVSSFTSKNFTLEGVTFSTVEFPSRARTFSRSVMSQSVGSVTEQEPQIDSTTQLILNNTNPSIDLLHNSRDQESEDEESIEMESYNPDKEQFKGHGDKGQSFYKQDDLQKQENKTQELNRINTQLENLAFSDQRYAIMCGRLCGKQEIKVRLKQSDTMAGPKVSIEINVGSLILFLSPRQVHILIELASGFARPDLEDNSNIAPRQKCVEKKMTELDYQRIEQELQQKLHPLSNFKGSGLQGIHGWSTALPTEEVEDEKFLPMRSNTGGVMYDSTNSNASSSMESSLSSSMASSFSTEQNSRPRSRRRGCNIETDPTAEISRFQIRLASLAAVILHDDVLAMSNTTSNNLIPSSVQQMQNIATSFFSNLGIFAISGYGTKDFSNARKSFEKACKLNHIRILGAPIQIEGDETTTSSAFAISGTLTAARLEILECLQCTGKENEGLIDFEYVPLLTFNEPNGNPLVLSGKPCFKMTLHHTEHNLRTGLSRKISTKTDIGITLESSTLELDVTIIDRVTALLNPQPICVITNPSPLNPWGQAVQSLNLIQTDSKTDIKISSPLLNVKLRFPVPDFRPPHDFNKVAWWKRNVRPDFLLFKLHDFLAQTSMFTNQTYDKYVIQAKNAVLQYFEKDGCPPIEIGKIGFLESGKVANVGATKFSIKILPVKKHSDLEQKPMEVDPMTTSIYGTFAAQEPEDKGPFSSKKVVHESDVPHAKLQDDSEEMIIPGDKAEIDGFIETATENSRIQIDLQIPLLFLTLPSKHIYELLYNRINSDLLLWEPRAPKPSSTNLDINVTFGNNFNNFPLTEEQASLFRMCKSGVQYDSDSDDDDINTEASGVYYSVYDRSMKQSNQKFAVNELSGQSFLAFNLQIDRGSLSMQTPCRDSTGNVIPSHRGNFVITVDDGRLCSISGYKGDEDLGYVCFTGKVMKLLHNGIETIPAQNEESYLKVYDTIYKSESGVFLDECNRGGQRDMVSVAVRIQANHETHHVKTVRVAVGVNKATLLHKVVLEPNSWVTQMIDMFNVQDYPIPGYTAKDVLTELHLHLWDCAIDYRPLYIPIKTIVTIGSFSMSSHLSAVANTSTLRFIAEECSLFISDKPALKGVPVMLRHDYVSVVDFGLFEVSLRTNDKKSGINPHIDLRASNDLIHIRTCSDSGRALMQLITYFASDGDLANENMPPPNQSLEEVTSSCNSNSNFSSPRHNSYQLEDHEELVSLQSEPNSISNLSKSQHQHIESLIDDAMDEELETERLKTRAEELEEYTPLGAKLFFFPDEKHPAPPDTMKPIPQVTYELGDVTFRSSRSSDTDEEFCFIGDDDGLGIISKNGLPEMRWTEDEGVRFMDVHFVEPLGKTDLLKPPRHYPTPIMRYTLCEMSLVWHMYGGNDFSKKQQDGEGQEKQPFKKVNFADLSVYEHQGGGIGFSKAEDAVFNFGPPTSHGKKKVSMPWRLKGGPNRNHDVLMELQLNKVKFTHETYPETTKQASRQVLLVTELEIRDRLESSQINKFLYQYTSEAMPKQSHAQMIVIKAVHIRPDAHLLQNQECCLRVSLLPLRLNIDQDSLLFLINFFTELSNTESQNSQNPKKSSEESGSCVNYQSRHSTPTHQPPILSVSIDEREIVKQVHEAVDENLLLLMDKEYDGTNEVKEDASATKTIPGGSEDAPIYFRNILFGPDVPIRLDYHGKRFDMKHGPLAGLLMGLGQLNCSELCLRRISNRHGILGLDKLITYMLQEWLNDIKRNQLPRLLGGIGPMHSLVQLFQGIKDLFWLPIEQYQKDGRIVRGLQRGANSFTTSTAMAALELTTRIIHLIQVTAETAYDMMSPGPSVRRRPRSKGRKKRYNQPQDIREGMANAINVVKEGIGETADNIVRIASHEHEQKGYSGAVGGVLRQIPPTLVKPIIVASEATNNVLGGMRSQLVPDARREANQKWRNDDR